MKLQIQLLRIQKAAKLFKVLHFNKHNFMSLPL